MAENDPTLAVPENERDDEKWSPEALNKAGRKKLEEAALIFGVGNPEDYPTDDALRHAIEAVR